MSLTHAQFDALVSRLEGEARANPAGYRLRVTLMALLGYVYLWLMLLLLAVLVIASAASVVYLKALGVKLLFVFVPFAWMVFSAMRVRLVAPNGLAITARDAPALFARIDALRKAIGAPRFHQVLVSGEFNACVSQVPLLGMFGWHRNYLVLGLPLLKSLTPAQLDAVLAHELGHLRGGHARLGNWFYRLRASWSQLQQQLHANASAGAFLFRPFFDWYAPRFNAYAFPLARVDEYEADATSATLCSPRTTAEALTAVNVIAAYLSEHYWPGIHAAANEQPMPAFAPFREFGRAFESDLPEQRIEHWLQQALQRPTTSDDTHPSLADRLRAIGHASALALPEPGTAADRLLGDCLDDITARLDAQWQAGVADGWQQQFETARSGRERLAALVAADAPGTDERLELAELEAEFGAGRDAAIARLRALVHDAPDHARVQFILGMYLLQQGDDAGEAHLRRAMELDVAATSPGLCLLRDHRWQRGDHAEAIALHREYQQRCEIELAAVQERERLLSTDRFIPHGVPPDGVAALAQALHALGARRAWLVQKRCEHVPERRQYVLGFSRIRWWQVHRKARALALQKRIVNEVSLPGDTLIACVDDDSRFARKLRKVAGSRVL